MAAKKDKVHKETEAEKTEREKREEGLKLGEIYPNPTKPDQGQEPEPSSDPEEAARQRIRDKRDDQ